MQVEKQYVSRPFQGGDIITYLFKLAIKGNYMSVKILNMGSDATKLQVSNKATQISLTYRDYIENCKFQYDTFQKANNKGADQSV